jgi:hypothetical protein
MPRPYAPIATVSDILGRCRTFPVDPRPGVADGGLLQRALQRPIEGHAADAEEGSDVLHALTAIDELPSLPYA